MFTHILPFNNEWNSSQAVSIDNFILGAIPEKPLLIALFMVLFE
jgi:hypothetical protein